MNPYEKFKWWYLGRVAETIEEQYESWADAILYPGMTLMLVSAVWYATTALIQLGGPVNLSLGIALAIVSVFATPLFATTVGASVVYASRRNEIEKGIIGGK